MNSSLWAKFMHSLARQVFICSNHALRAIVFCSGFSVAMISFMSANTDLTSPTMGTSIFTRFDMDAGSMSMWIMVRGLDKKSVVLPITLSSKRAPTASKTSHSCMAILASYVPCMPSMPKNFLSEAGKPPKPMRVLVIGRPSACINLIKCSAASPRTTPPPE